MRYFLSLMLLCLLTPLVNASEKYGMIERIDTRGPGCSNGSLYWRLSNDDRYLTLEYDALDLNVSPSSRRSTYCTLSADLYLNSGWEVGVRAVRMTGSAYVSDSSSEATINISQEMDRYGRSTLSDRRQPGYFNGNYDFSDVISSSRIRWSGCERRVYWTFDTEIGGQTSSNGQISMRGSGSRNTTVQEVEFTFRRCGSGGDDWYRGECTVVLETVWGEDFGKYTGYSRERSYSRAVDIAKQEGRNRCEDARNGNDILRCNVDNNHCTATREKQVAKK